MTDSLEVLCLEGLEKALIGYQVSALGKPPTLVYDYDTAVALLVEAGFARNEIDGFLADIDSIDFLSPPVFVRLDELAKANILRGDRYFFDDGNETIHWGNVSVGIRVSYAIYGPSSRWTDGSAGKAGAVYL